MSKYTMSAYASKDDLIKDALVDLERHKKALASVLAFLDEYHWLDDDLMTKAKKEIEAILNEKSPN